MNGSSEKGFELGETFRLIKSMNKRKRDKIVEVRKVLPFKGRTLIKKIMYG